MKAFSLFLGMILSISCLTSNAKAEGLSYAERLGLWAQQKNLNFQTRRIQECQRAAENISQAHERLPTCKGTECAGLRVIFRSSCAFYALNGCNRSIKAGLCSTPEPTNTNAAPRM